MVFLSRFDVSGWKETRVVGWGCSIGKDCRERVVRLARAIFETCADLHARFLAWKSGYLEYGSEELRANPRVVLASVSTNGWMLQYASETLRNDKEVVRKAVANCSVALAHASNTLRNDKNFANELLAKGSLYFLSIGDDLKKDRDFILACVKGASSEESVREIFRDMHNDLRENYPFVLQMVKANKEVLCAFDFQEALNYLRYAEGEIIWAALDPDPQFLRRISWLWMCDKQFIQPVALRYPQIVPRLTEFGVSPEIVRALPVKADT